MTAAAGASTYTDCPLTHRDHAQACVFVTGTVAPLGNPAMKTPMMGTHMAMPNLVSMLPNVTAGAMTVMKNLIAKEGVASIGDLRGLAVEADVNMIACQMTMDLFESKLEDMIAGPKLGSAATYMESALKSDINLYI